MKLARITLSGASVALLVIQLALVSSIAAKYLYQRLACPRVWTRASAYDPEMLMRGRYLSLQLTVDGCQSTLPSAREAAMPRNLEGVPVGTLYSIHAPQVVRFPAQLKVVNNKLEAIRIPDSDSRPSGVMVEGVPGTSCQNLRLAAPVDFYIAEHATDPSRLQPGQELWIEVTVPPQGPPRPLQLAMKQDGAWKPLAFQ
ncbi:MAG: hypothetical protein P4K94_07860 [Terracidiphilus sp.]|nr:hypothetical protein [Terracidiphilus sp.]